MSEDTEKFCRDFGPFRPIVRFNPPVPLAGYAVRSRIGEDVAFTDTPDQARAVAESLNLTAESAKNAKAEARGDARPTSRKIPTMEETSDKFHAFEWLRGAALEGNKHAATLAKELVELNDRIRDPHFWEKQ